MGEERAGRASSEPPLTPLCPAAASSPCPGGRVAAPFRAPEVPAGSLRRAVAAEGGSAPRPSPVRDGHLLAGPVQSRPGRQTGAARQSSPRSGGLLELVKLLLGWVFQRELRLLPKLLVKVTHCQSWLWLFCSCRLRCLPSRNGGIQILRAASWQMGRQRWGRQ